MSGLGHQTDHCPAPRLGHVVEDERCGGEVAALRCKMRGWVWVWVGWMGTEWRRRLPSFLSARTRRATSPPSSVSGCLAGRGVRGAATGARSRRRRPQGGGTPAWRGRPAVSGGGRRFPHRHHCDGLQAHASFLATGLWWCGGGDEQRGELGLWGVFQLKCLPSSSTSPSLHGGKLHPSAFFVSLFCFYLLLVYLSTPCLCVCVFTSVCAICHTPRLFLLRGMEQRSSRVPSCSISSPSPLSKELPTSHDSTIQQSACTHRAYPSRGHTGSYI